MQIRLIAAGKLREGYAAQACAEFAKRLAPYYAFDVVEVRAGDGRDPAAAMRDEAGRILNALQPGDRVGLLDRSGDEFSSTELAAKLEGVAGDGVRRLCIVVAGTFGSHETLRIRANLVWSLSKLTFLHEWARMIAIEQLYRAAKIARNEPYHH